MLDKSRSITVDCIAYDLEDSVAVRKKVEARANICRFLQQPRPAMVQEIAVRVNSVGSTLAETDLIEIVSCDGEEAVEELVRP